MDVAKQVSYWRDTAAEDMETAELLFEKERYRHALFLAHLAIEKMLKAHVTKNTKNVPPKRTDFLTLARLAGVLRDQRQRDFLLRFDLYGHEGSYPDALLGQFGSNQTQADFAGSAELFQELSQDLNQN